MEKDMLVKARYKDAPEDEWFDVLLAKNKKMYEKATGKEIVRTDLFLDPRDGSGIVDMEKEWNEYRREKLLEAFQSQASFLAKQIEYNRKKYNGELEE